MKRTRRTFSAEEKLSIVREAEREGSAVTYRKYNLSPNLLHRWKQKYLAQGVSGLKNAYHRIDPEKRELEEENERLKRIVAKQALELEFKTELLKHAQIDPSKKKR
jgi:transposase-like protein